MSEDKLMNMSQEDMEAIANAPTRQFLKLPLTWEHKERISTSLKRYHVSKKAFKRQLEELQEKQRLVIK